MRNLIKTLWIIPLIILFNADLIYSFQTLPPPLLPDPNQAPIDGGLGLLAAAGGIYAYKKLRENQK